MEEKQNSRNISIVKDLNGNNIVIINDIVFKGKKSISWKDVEKYLMRYVGELYTIAAPRRPRPTRPGSACSRAARMCKRADYTSGSAPQRGRYRAFR